MSNDTHAPEAKPEAARCTVCDGTEPDVDHCWYCGALLCAKHRYDGRCSSH